MAGSLVKIAETTVSSAVASVTLTGIDSTYDVYKVVVSNMQPDTDIQQLRKRFTESGTPNTTANYDQAYKRFRAENTFQNTSATNQDNFGQYDSLGTGTGELYNEQFYIFNANNSSEYTFATWEATFFDWQPYARGIAGGVVLTQTTSVDGLHFYMSSGNIASGTFKLYGLVK